MDYLGEKGYGMTMTCRRDRFPKGLKDYLHRETGTGKQEKAKVMRYEMPIVAVKQCLPTSIYQDNGIISVNGRNQSIGSE